MSTKPTALISGASIGGPACAYWLTRAGVQCTVVERAHGIRKEGQGIDIRDEARKVLDMMPGVEDAIKSFSTQEKGLAFLDPEGREIAVFEANGDQSFTCDLEIVRGKLATIFYDYTKEETEYIFGDSIEDIQDDEGEQVGITFKSGVKRKFDFVVGADGMRSKTRSIIMPETVKLYSLGQYTAFFTIPSIPTDGEFGRWCTLPGTRTLLLRPNEKGITSAFLSTCSPDAAGYHKMSVSEQKNLVKALFRGAGWETDRVLAELEGAEDFYMQEIAQVRIPSWTKNRVALLGDAAFCPSPISGKGTSLALLAAYILAGEIEKCNGNWAEGLRAYEKTMRPYVQSAQSLPPGIPRLLNPASDWGVWTLGRLIGTVSWIAKSKIGAWFYPLAEWFFRAKEIALPGNYKLELRQK